MTLADGFEAIRFATDGVDWLMFADLVEEYHQVKYRAVEGCGVVWPDAPAAQVAEHIRRVVRSGAYPVAVTDVLGSGVRCQLSHECGYTYYPTGRGQ